MIRFIEIYDYNHMMPISVTPLDCCLENTDLVAVCGQLHSDVTMNHIASDKLGHKIMYQNGCLVWG